MATRTKPLHKKPEPRGSGFLRLLVLVGLAVSMVAAGVVKWFAVDNRPLPALAVVLSTPLLVWGIADNVARVRARRMQRTTKTLR